MYDKSYKEARDLAEQIRIAAYKGQTVEEKPKPKGFVPQKEKEEVVEPEEQKSTMDSILKYMIAVQDSFAQMPQVDIPSKSFYGNVNPNSAVEALGLTESNGNYRAIGPEVKKGAYAGQRAVGKYQVMEGNVGPWTKEVLGESLSVQEFLDSPAAQDAVAEYKMQQSYEKYGNWDDAASVWFSGRPMAKAGNASDGYHTVPEYISKFRNNYKKVSNATS